METNWNEEQLVREYANRDRSITDWRLGYSQVLDLLGDVKRKRIIDYGCGSGRFARRLSDLGARVYAVDISEKALQEAMKRPTGSTSIRYQLIKSGDLSSVPLSDAAVINLVLCCIRDKDETVRVLSSVCEKLPLGEPLVICEPHPEGVGHAYVSYSSRAQGKLKSGTRIKVKLKGLSKEFCDYWRPKQEYFDLVEKSGFMIETVREPLANQQELFWKDEKTQAPYLIIKAIRGEK